jgi:hypothetical protein
MAGAAWRRGGGGQRGVERRRTYMERVCFVGRGRPPDQGFRRMGEIFHLD